MPFSAFEGYFLPLTAFMRSEIKKKYAHVKTFEQIEGNKIFCMMYGLAVIEVMSLSGHFSNIDEIFLQNHPGYAQWYTLLTGWVH